MKKLTYDEIIEALRCCNSIVEGSSCLKCPLYRFEGKCTAVLIDCTLDIIKRQKEENEMLESSCETLETYNKHYQYRVKEVQRFNDGLTKQIEELTEELQCCTDIKNKAIKEFAERFESKLSCIPQHHFTLNQVLYDLDSLKKEMGCSE